MAWKIDHTSWESGFTTLERPRNKKEATERFEKLKGKYIGLITLHSPSGKKIDEHYTPPKKEKII